MNRMKTGAGRFFAFLMVVALILACFAPVGAAQPARPRSVKASSLSLNKKKLTLWIGSDGCKPYTLQCRIKPSGATALEDPSLIRWTSAKPSVASVENGVVTALSPGKTRITAKLLDGSKKKASCQLTVKPVSIYYVGLENMYTQIGDVRPLEYKFLPLNAYSQKIAFSSSNAKVATVDASGNVTAVGLGKATITGKSTASGKKGTCVVEVTPAITPDDPNAGNRNYFFYGVSNYLYMAPRTRIYGDNNGVELNKLYGKASFGGKRVQMDIRDNLTSYQMSVFLEEIAANPAITENDVTFFYYFGHGASDGTISGINGSISIRSVQRSLDKIPGRVVVLLDTCHAGAYISKGQACAFNDAVISAFAGVNSKALTDSPQKNKYKVLTACAQKEESYSTSGVNMGLFTLLFTKGLIGSPSVADVNRNQNVTLDEMYLYIKAQTPMIQSNYRISSSKQNVQVWPENDSTPIYARY